MQPVTTSPKEPSLPTYLTLPTTLLATLTSISSMCPRVNVLTRSIGLRIFTLQTFLLRLV